MAKEYGSVGWIPRKDKLLADWIKERDWALVEGLTEFDEEAPMPVYLHLDRSADGRLVCTGMVIGRFANYDVGPTEITARVLRTIRIPELIDIAIRSQDASGGFGDAVKQLLAAAPAQWGAAVRPGRSGYSLDHFRDVASLYRAAVAAHETAPVAWMAEQYDRPEVTVRRWIKRARDEGFLGASTPGRAGETAVDEETS